MRVVHLVEAAGPQACPATLAMLSDGLGRLGAIDQCVLLLGGAALRREAQAVGIGPATHQAVPFGRGLYAWFAVRRRLDALGAFDVLHTWSIGAFSLAALMYPGVAVLLTLTSPPTPRQAHWLRTLTGDPAVGGRRRALLASSSSLRRQLLSHGVAASAAHVLRPGIDAGRLHTWQRQRLRDRWGVAEADAKVLAVLADQPRTVDALEAALIAGMAAESYSAAEQARQPIRLLLHPDSRRRQRAQRMMQAIDRPGRIVLEPRLDRPWEVLPGCDAALALDDSAVPHGPGLSLQWSMAASVPVAGQATYAVSEVLEDRHSALLAKPGQRRLLAHRMRQLLDDRPLAWKLRDTARHEAFSFFSRVQYCRGLQSVYEQIVEGRVIEVPAMAVTGGLRFMGRA